MLAQGDALMHGFDSMSEAEQYAKQNNIIALPTPDLLNPGKFQLSAKNTNTFTVEAIVNWVVGDEASITYDNGGMEIISIPEGGYKVIRESAPSYQSSVADMSEEDLRASLDALRTSRAKMPSVKTKVRKQVVKMSPIEKLLADAPPEKVEELKRRLGLVL